MAKVDLRYVYYKQAISLRQNLLVTFNTGARGSCNSFVQNYDTLRKLVEEHIIPEMADSPLEIYRIGGKLTMPIVFECEYPWRPTDATDKMNEVAMAIDQMISLLEGLGGSLEKEMEALKKENIKLSRELKSVKLLIPNEVLIKVPKNLNKIITEVNVAYKAGVMSATGILLRKTVEGALHLKCQMTENENKLKDSKTGDFYDLPKIIDVCAGIGIIRPNRAKDLKKIKLYGDSAAHSLTIELTPQEMEEAGTLARLLLEELFG